MTLESKQTFTNNTGYMRRSNKEKNDQVNVSKLENSNYTPLSELPINAKVEPSDNTVSRV